MAHVTIFRPGKNTTKLGFFHGNQKQKRKD